MKYKESAAQFGVCLLILFGLGFIIAPVLTTIIRSYPPFGDVVNWQNGGLLDPNGAPPLSLLALAAYASAGLVMAKWFKSKSVLYALFSGVLYTLFQALNFGWLWQYQLPFGIAGELILTFLTVVGLTVGAAYLGTVVFKDE